MVNYHLKEKPKKNIRKTYYVYLYYFEMLEVKLRASRVELVTIYFILIR